MLRPLVLFLVVLGCAAASPAREVVNFNADWRFLRDDPAGAAAPAFADGGWQQVSLPHTFNDEDTFDDWSLPGHRGEQNQWSGRTWYRKAFTAPRSWAGRRVFIEFEAVRQVAEVWLNGRLLGTAKGGFTPFGFDLTEHLRFDGPNVLAVMADNRFMRDPLDPSIAPQAATTDKTHPNLAQLSRELMERIPATLDELQADQIPWNNPHWHPAHGGIYRNVRLIVTDPLHITLPLYSFLQTEGPYAYATGVSAAAATVTVEVPVRNDRSQAAEFSAAVDISGADRSAFALSPVRARLGPGATTKLTFTQAIPQPRLWEPTSPHVYRVRITLAENGRTIDQHEIPLGVRAIRWDAANGLWLNGRHLKLRGWGQKATNEWPGLGAALPDWLQAYTLQLMKDAGGNFLRWGHVPGSPAQVRAADELGIVTLQPGGDGEHDTVGGAWALRVANFRDVLIYYRNHPSIFIWEGGNQKVSREHAAELRALMDRYDPHGQRAYAHRRADQVTAEFMDVGIGTEGGREIASLPVVEGEYNREESPRRVWDDFSPPNFGYPEAKGQTYQLTSEQFAVNQVKHFVTKLGPAHHSGGANWIFSDSTSGGRVGVEVARAGGEVDGVRLPKEAWHVCRVLFANAPAAHIVGHWSYPAGTRKTVHVVANTGGEVELSLNGHPLGRVRAENGYLYVFPDVAFAPGELRATALDATGQPAATDAMATADAPAALRLTPITAPGGLRADGSDVVLFDVEAVDAKGRRCPTFQQRVDFELKGAGIWRGGYNSGRAGSINHTHLDLEAGLNRVAVRSTRTPGRIKLTASTAGLAPATASVLSREFHGAAPAWPAIAVPAAPVADAARFQPKETVAATAPAGQAGRFIKSCNYSGPNASIVHVEVNARDGRNAYVNVDSGFPSLPSSLAGADWLQADNRDALYHAVDLIELTVVPGAIVSIAHDDRLPRPPWLGQLGFAATPESLVVLGRRMTIFRRPASAQEASLTLGPNTEDSSATAGNMYLVFAGRP